MTDNVIPLRRKTDPPIPEVTLEATTQRAQVIVLLAGNGEQGVTWIDVSALLGLHHGSASGLLSNLHREGRIVRLQEKRDGCLIYVLSQFVAGRRISPYKPRDHLTVDLMAEALRRFYKPCRHDPNYPHATCKQCEAGVLLREYDNNKQV